eukprot:COSAG02_NODE_6691_length_3419_cov_1.999699_2_plen_62_part_00
MKEAAAAEVAALAAASAETRTAIEQARAPTLGITPRAAAAAATIMGAKNCSPVKSEQESDL